MTIRLRFLQFRISPLRAYLQFPAIRNLIKSNRYSNARNTQCETNLRTLGNVTNRFPTPVISFALERMVRAMHNQLYPITSYHLISSTSARGSTILRKSPLRSCVALTIGRNLKKSVRKLCTILISKDAFFSNNSSNLPNKFLKKRKAPMENSKKISETRTKFPEGGCSLEYGVRERE